MATHSSTLAWRIPWTEEPGQLQSIGCKESDMTDMTEHSRMHDETDNWCLSLMAGLNCSWSAPESNRKLELSL